VYQSILVTLDTTQSDRAIIDHVKRLATFTHGRVMLLHVATGWAARTFGPDAVSPEIGEDKTYLDSIRAEFEAAGVAAEAELAYGDPVKEIVRRVSAGDCDLLAMSTHGHRFLADLFLGVTANRVQHSVGVPVLLLRAS
jgi:nucleotide-binding universal stress UspA family protein